MKLITVILFSSVLMFSCASSVPQTEVTRTNASEKARAPFSVEDKERILGGIQEILEPFGTVKNGNTNKTWDTVKKQVERYLKANVDAYYVVQIGIGTTMTPEHVLDKNEMILSVSVAPHNDPDFIMYSFSQPMLPWED